MMRSLPIDFVKSGLRGCIKRLFKRKERKGPDSYREHKGRKVKALAYSSLRSLHIPLATFTFNGTWHLMQP
jgi:hypothetical protein